MMAKRMWLGWVSSLVVAQVRAHTPCSTARRGEWGEQSVTPSHASKGHWQDTRPSAPPHVVFQVKRVVPSCQPTINASGLALTHLELFPPGGRYNTEGAEKPRQLRTLVGFFRTALPAVFSPEKDPPLGGLLVTASQH